MASHNLHTTGCYNAVDVDDYSRIVGIKNGAHLIVKLAMESDYRHHGIEPW